MKTIEEILNNYEKEWATFLDDRFGVRLCQFLTEEQINSIGFSLSDEFKGKHIAKMLNLDLKKLSIKEVFHQD